MVNTQSELRAFTLGMFAGLVIVVGSLFAVSRIVGIRWQPVSVKAEVSRSTAWPCPYVDGPTYRTYTCEVRKD